MKEQNNTYGKAQIADIIPGRILWEVSCIDGRFCGKNRDFDTKPYKIVVLGKPTYKDGIFSEPSPFFKNEKTWPDHFSGKPYTSIFENSLNDCGVGCKYVYNLHRLFTSYEAAMDYISQCKRGVFKDPVDQEFYDCTSTEEYRQRREADDQLLEELVSSCFDY